MLAVNGRFLRNPQPAGMQRVARSLLIAARAEGMEFEVLAPPGVADPLVARSVGRTPQSRAGDLAWEQTALPRAARGRPVLSLCNTAPLAARRSAVMLHDVAWTVNPGWYSRGIGGYRTVAMTAARRAEVVLSVSETAATELAEHGIERGKIRVVRNAVDDDVHPSSEADVTAAIEKFKLGRPYLLVVGWSNPRKDIATAVAAHLQVLADIPHDLVMVGPSSPTFSTAVLPEGGRVRIFGYVERADLLALMTGAAGFIYPTRYEGFGIPPLEALRCGTPALVSDLPVLRETGGSGPEFIPVGDVDGWSSRMAAALRGELRAGNAPDWTWRDAARALVAALRPLIA